MKAFVPEERWLKLLRGWRIADCTVRSSGFVYLVAREIISEEQISETLDHDIPTRFLVIYLGSVPVSVASALHGKWFQASPATRHGAI